MFVNVKNINKVADAIEAAAKAKEGLRGTIGFNMSVVARTTNKHRPDHVDSCGTVACIAGWSYALLHPELDASQLVKESDGAVFIGMRMGHEVPSAAAEFLGLDLGEAERLFVPDDVDDFSAITAHHAVAVLRHLAKTGKVDWSVGAPK